MVQRVRDHTDGRGAWAKAACAPSLVRRTSLRLQLSCRCRALPVNTHARAQVTYPEFIHVCKHLGVNFADQEVSVRVP